PDAYAGELPVCYVMLRPGAECETDEVGVVIVSGPHVSPGYRNPEHNKGVFENGVLNSGDLAYTDADGRLHIAGRSKDLIIRSGHNIDPKVIEDALGAHPAVQLCAAVGAPDAYAGELPVIFATLVPGASATEDELLAFTSARVDEAPARPKWVSVITTMPMTNVGKIYKPELRAMAARQVVAATVAEVCTALGLGDAARPAVATEGESLVHVQIDAAAAGAQAAALQERLQKALEPLPFKTRIALK
ncbi:MAG: AMP-binding protein, partial [Variovorax sp.]|nr:AMP-binding protein [Variovorax sp.]